MDQLIQAYRAKRLILFVGAGVSMGLGLPSWRQLVDHMAKELGFDPDVYRGGHRFVFFSPLVHLVPVKMPARFVDLLLNL